MAAGGLAAAQSVAPPTAEADALYAKREDPSSAQRAAGIWADRAAGGKDFEASWKLARACYWIGTQGADAKRRAALEQGVKAGEQAVGLAPTRPDGHFWLAANMGALAESYGLRQGLKYRGRIREALERVLAIDPAWLQGSADRALGRWYFKVPGLFGGSRSKARTHLEKALSYHPQSTLTLLFLADLEAADGHRDKARELYQRVIDAPLDPEWGPEDRVNKRLAAERLKTTRTEHPRRP